MFKSDTIKELATALVSAQKAMSNAKINAENSHFGNEYADLPAVRDAIIGPLTDNDIAIVQIPSINKDTGHFMLVTALLHAPSGEFIGGEHPLPTTGTPQQVGSALTYARRQDASGIVFISADKDDDAEVAEGRQDTQIVRVAPLKPANDNVPFVKLEPQLLPFDSDFLEWGTRFAAQLNASASEKECDAWILANQTVLAAVHKSAPAIHKRLVQIASRHIPTSAGVVQQKKKTDARDGTSAKSAAEDLDEYRLALLKAPGEKEINALWASWEAPMKSHGQAMTDKAVDMLETRLKQARQTASNVATKAA